MFAGVTTTVGPFPSGTVIGFWVRADGFNNANSPDFWVSYTTDVLTNRDGQRHIAWTKIDNRVIVGFEDLNNLGDKDYNDGKQLIFFWGPGIKLNVLFSYVLLHY